MRQFRYFIPLAAAWLIFAAPAAQARTPQQTATPRSSAKAATPGGKSATDSVSKEDARPEIELQKAVDSAGNDRAALVHNLKDYLRRFPDAPRKASVYRALVESCEQLQDRACALDYTERLIAVSPDDTEMMMMAVALLQEQGDDASLTRASGYVSRVLDRVEKSAAADRPARTSLEDWRAQHDDVRSGLYYVRGNIEKTQKNYDAATKDLQTSYSVVPNALAAQSLGEIAELRHDTQTAVEEYTLAFVLPESGPAGKVDRRDVRQSLGNVWRMTHPSEAGLGEAILASYDRLNLPAPKVPASERNKDAKDAFGFVLRRLDGTPESLAAVKGKVVVLSFWATWCGPCREVEPGVSQVAESYAGNTDVTFYAVDTDEDQALVAPFVAHEKWKMPVVFADGLDDFLNVASLPTLMVLDRSGTISYRADGLDPDTFPASLITAIQNAL
ncbi:MAG TPA: thioredoxin domain-containing protein, partial [Candidatus Acidoferrales bacterium]